jgi:hypothetical protein
MDSSLVTDRVHPPSVFAPSNACANCDAPQVGEYCYACGQHFLEGRLTIRRLVLDFVVRKLGLEGGLLRTIVDLTIRPASMIRAYVDGRRQRYTNPVAYLLLSAGAYVLFAKTWQEPMAAGFRAENAELQGLEGIDAESMVQVQLFMDAHPSLMTVVLCLFLVPALRLLFLRSTTTAEATVFSLYVSGHLLLMQIVINVGALVSGADVYRAMTGRTTWIPAVLLLFLAGRFFGTRFSSFLKFTVALACAVAGLVILMTMAVVVVSALAAAAPVAPSP